MPPRTDPSSFNTQVGHSQSAHNPGFPPGAGPQSTLTASAPTILGYHPISQHHLPVSQRMAPPVSTNSSVIFDNEDKRRISRGDRPLSVQEIQAHVRQQTHSSAQAQQPGTMQSNVTLIQQAHGHHYLPNPSLAQARMPQNQAYHPRSVSSGVTHPQSSGQTMQHSGPSYGDLIRSTLRECLLDVERNNASEFEKLTELMQGRLSALDEKVDSMKAVQLDGFKAVLGKLDRLEKVVGVKEARKATSRAPTVGVDGGRDKGGGGEAEGSAKASKEATSLWARLDSIECDVLELLERMQDPLAGMPSSPPRPTTILQDMATSPIPEPETEQELPPPKVYTETGIDVQTPPPTTPNPVARTQSAAEMEPMFRPIHFQHQGPNAAGSSRLRSTHPRYAGPEAVNGPRTPAQRLHDGYVSDVSTDYIRPTPGPSSAPYDRTSDDGSRFGSHSGYGDNDATLKTRGQKMVPVDWSKTRSEAQRYRGAYDSLSVRHDSGQDVYDGYATSSRASTTPFPDLSSYPHDTIDPSLISAPSGPSAPEFHKPDEPLPSPSPTPSRTPSISPPPGRFAPTGVVRGNVTPPRQAPPEVVPSSVSPQEQCFPERCSPVAHTEITEPRPIPILPTSALSSRESSAVRDILNVSISPVSLKQEATLPPSPHIRSVNSDSEMPRQSTEPTTSSPPLPAQLHIPQDTQESTPPGPPSRSRTKTPATQAQVSPSTSAVTRVSLNTRHRSRTAGTPETTVSTELTRVSVPPFSSMLLSKTSPKVSVQPFSRFNGDGREVVQLTDYARAASASTGMMDDQDDDDHAHASVSVGLGEASKWENASESGFGVGADSGSAVGTGVARTVRESLSPLTDLTDEEAEPARKLRERHAASGSGAAAKTSKRKKRKFAEFDADQNRPVSALGSVSAKDRTKTQKSKKQRNRSAPPIPPPSEERMKELLGADGRLDWPLRMNETDAVKKDKHIQCERCNLWYHTVCVGLSTSAQINWDKFHFVCPLCIAFPSEATERQSIPGRKDMCSRPDCPHPKNEGDYFVEKIIGRRWIIGDPELDQDFTERMYDQHPPDVLASSKGRFIWLIKWIDWDYQQATWEEEEESHKQYIPGFEKSAKKESLGKALKSKYEPVILKEARNVGWI